VSFFGELKRRNVVKVGVAYAVVAWLLIQVADTLLPTFGAPEWVMPVFSAIVILGFPLALVLAWAFDVTPGGIKMTSAVEPDQTITQSTGQRLNYDIIGLLLLAVGFLLVSDYFPDSSDVAVVAEETPAASVSPAQSTSALATQPTRRDRLPNSVAVLPLENLSPDPNNAYVAAGLHEEILNQLAKLRNLNVIARTSVMRYGENRPSIDEIAAALNVQSIMEGSIRYAGNRIRVTTQLIDAATGSHLWSETYDREFDDIFAIESDIAMNVANALQAEFSLAEQERIESKPTDSPAAYALYLQGLNAFPDMSEVHRYLDQAILLDPQFALAYARKSRLYSFMRIDDFTIGAVVRSEQADLERLARENAQRALAIDPNQAQAYLAIAELEQVSWRWEEARQAFEQALRLSPNDPSVLSRYIWHNSYSGRHAEAIAAAERLVDLEASPGAYYRLGTAFGYAGDLEAARRSLEHSFELAQRPGGAARLWLLQVLVGLGDRDAALEQLAILELMQPETPSAISLAGLAYAYGRLGRRADAVRLFTQLEELSVSRPVGAGSWALANLAVENIERALEWLRIGVEKMENQQTDEGYYHLMAFKTNAWSDSRIEEPAFRALRDRMDALN